MKLIALYGSARSGKDTAARYLASLMKLEHYAFANPLKDMLTSVFGDHFYQGDRERICPETGKSYRFMMQTLGTELGRNTWHEDVWINLVQRKWEEVKRENRLGQAQPALLGGRIPANGMVLSDLRFESEAEWVRSQGGIVIEIRRDDRDPIHGVPGHASEAGINSCYIDHTVDNNADLLTLYSILADLMDQLYGS